MKSASLHTAAIALSLSLAIAGTVAAEQVISVPVKVLSQKKQEPTQASMGFRTPAIPTMPSGKLPQYQFGKNQFDANRDYDSNDPKLRVILALPSEPRIIEFSIMINGLPFRMTREQRVKDYIQQVQKASAQSTPGESQGTTAATESSSAIERIQRYIASTGTEASEREVRSFIDHWIDGPQILFLNDHFQRFRSTQNPVFAVLDRDADGVLSREEAKSAMNSFVDCDLNRDGVVQALEVDQAARERKKRSATSISGKLLHTIPDAESAVATYESLAARYSGHAASQERFLGKFDPDADGQFGPSEIELMQTSPPDLMISVYFDTSDPNNALMTLNASTLQGPSNSKPAVADGKSLRLKLGEELVVISAVQAGASDQISIGAVLDGYALLPELDPDGDGRFTSRELRSMEERLNAFDANHDGTVTEDEARPPIRVCLGLGALVHGELAAVRTTVETPQTTVAGPEWFVRMDRNKDNDLIRAEFPGTDEQFAAIDSDGDLLISADEALKSETK